MRILSWSRSDTGRKRDHNEDSLLTDGDLGLFAVADGMGGHQGGERASRMALEVLRKEVSSASPDYARAAAEIEADAQRRELRTTRNLSRITIDPDPTLDPTLDEETGPLLPAVPERDIPTEPVVQHSAPPTVVMRNAARRACGAIFEAASLDPSLRGMGTTLTALLFEEGRAHVVHAGDSRAYLFRDGKIKQITEDHSWIAEQVRSGLMSEAEARESQFRHVITRSVGFERDVDVDTAAIAIQAGDCFLLCSDGMSNYVDADELCRILGATWYRRAPQLLVDIANDRGGDDNITVVVVYCANDAEPPA